ncbi:hypothetical protein C8Q70DRAFT_262935 [Cubamyces menziesii]|uniref:Uncharacterized protein n=1 Tax=Trametes cubensis TaxID=1111947 RepID=A0AAD7TZH3_9APHY|nr:hypothetical protein C8Q70DRAFT_262935 [Cubamyces menziesii]KAJ8490120.1 hypothetical protein ONZ51_g2495 [Trametes cubensis]
MPHSLPTTPESGAACRSRPRNSLPRELRKRRMALIQNGRMPDKETYDALYREIESHPGCEWYTRREHSNWITEKKRARERNLRDLIPEPMSRLPTDDVPQQLAADDALLPHSSASPCTIEDPQPNEEPQASLATTPQIATGKAEVPGAQFLHVCPDGTSIYGDLEVYQHLRDGQCYAYPVADVGFGDGLTLWPAHGPGYSYPPLEPTWGVPQACDASPTGLVSSDAYSCEEPYAYHYD